jgi:hypothetical protein
MAFPTGTVNLWFNPNAFDAPPPYQFGSSGIGLSSHVENLALMKKFPFG